MQQNLPSEEGKKDLDPKQKTDRIVELGSSVVTNHHGTIHCLTIIGQIEGHTNAPDNAKTTKYEHLLPLLASLEESDDVDGVLILLHDQAHGHVGAGWRPFYWHSTGGFRPHQYDRAIGLYDSASGAYERNHDRCTADLPIF